MTLSQQVMEIIGSTVILGIFKTIALITGTGKASIYKVETTRSQLEQVMTQSGAVMEMTSSTQVMEITPSTGVMGMIP